jgi:Flp pilus assembly protein TadB
MLSNSERQTLAEIEERLKSQDPAFVHRFENDASRVAAKKTCSQAWRAWLVATALMWGIAIVMASPAIAALAVSVMSVGLILWGTDGCHPPHPRRPGQR